MSMGSKLKGPSAPTVRGKTSRHPKFKGTKPVMAKSPRIMPAPLVSNASAAVSGTPAEPDYRRNDSALTGILATDTGKVRRPARNTNANRKNGGGSTAYKPKAEDLAGRDMITPPLTHATVRAPARIANTRYDKSKREELYANAEAAGFRDRAMQERSITVTNGAVALDRLTPLWLEGEE